MKWFERMGTFAARLDKDEFERRLTLLKEHYQALAPDPFGLDLDYARFPARAAEVLHRLYFRTRVSGIESVPARAGLLVSNHSGQLPLDAAIIAAAFVFDRDPPRLVRSMVERWVATLPLLPQFFARVGQVPGTPENCRLLLDRGELVLAFPEGVRGISKPFTRRYDLERFGHGFMRIALETRCPVVTVSVIGAEEQYISLGNLDWAAKRLGFPVLPLLPQLLLPGGVLPLPTRYHLAFGEPMHFEGDPADEQKVAENVWLVRQTIQSMLRTGLEARQGIFK